MPADNWKKNKKQLDKFGWFLTLKKGFENQNFATFRVLQSIQINSDEKKISKQFFSEYKSTPCSLFGSKLHNCNHAILGLLGVYFDAAPAVVCICQEDFTFIQIGSGHTVAYD